jgi:hypothetical protein
MFLGAVVMSLREGMTVRVMLLGMQYRPALLLF